METNLTAAQRRTYERLVAKWPGHRHFPKLDGDHLVTLVYFDGNLKQLEPVQQMESLARTFWPYQVAGGRVVCHVPSVVADILSMDDAANVVDVPFEPACALWRRGSDDDGWELEADWSAILNACEDDRRLSQEQLVETVAALLASGMTASSSDVVAVALCALAEP